MTIPHLTKAGLAATVAAAFATLAVLPSPVGAEPVITAGNGQRIEVSWTENDPDDLLGIPGNVHVGFVYAESGAFGTFFHGNVTDFECEEGEHPFGGPHGGHGANADVVEEGGELAVDAAEDAIEDVIDSGGSSIDADVVKESVEGELEDEVGEIIEEEFEEEFPGCEYIQDRFLGGEDVTMTVDRKRKVATMTGTLTVSNGGHGEPGEVLGNPPINLTITGGEWQKFSQSYSVQGSGYRFEDSQNGTMLQDGVVEGAIGAMGFADDADDESFASFTYFRFRTLERVR